MSFHVFYYYMFFGLAWFFFFCFGWRLSFWDFYLISCNRKLSNKTPTKVMLKDKTITGSWSGVYESSQELAGGLMWGGCC